MRLQTPTHPIAVASRLLHYLRNGCWTACHLTQMHWLGMTPIWVLCCGGSWTITVYGESCKVVHPRWKEGRTNRCTCATNDSKGVTSQGSTLDKIFPHPVWVQLRVKKHCCNHHHVYP